MTKRLLQGRIGLLAAAGTVALLAVVAVPIAAGGNGNGSGNSNNRLLAAGTATERLGGGVQWHIQFQIHARNNGKSSKVSVQTPTSTFSYVGSVCSGSYTTAAGTTVYVVGRQTSFAGTGFGAPYHGYSIHKGGPMGADFSWVSSFASLAAAQAACANPAVSLPTPFALDAASVRFKV
jgi:hypothetical protein